MMGLIYLNVCVLVSLLFGGVGWFMLMLLVVEMFYLLFSHSIHEGFSMFDALFFVDSCSFSLAMLSIFLLVLMIMSSISVLNYNFYSMKYLVHFMLLLLFLMLSFLSMNMIMFYFFFEGSLIPTLYIIMGWGYQSERLQAGIYFMMYTLFVSLPLLFLLIYLELSFKNLFMLNYSGSLIFLGFSGGTFVLFIKLVALMAFFVKLPLFLVHLWLPSAHVEAPVAGSMILAGVLLKLGGYGLLRVVCKFSMWGAKISGVAVSLSLIGMVAVGVTCCYLNDMKALVAYSSVAHMSLVVCSVLTNYSWGLMGALVMMVSHGLSSSGLFCFVNQLYERMGSRSLYISKGVITWMPLFSLMMFLLCCSNISAPPSINLLSELMILTSICSFDPPMLCLFGFGSFLGAVFSFYFYSYGSHGSMYVGLLSLFSGAMVDFHVVMLHIIPINLMVLKNDVFFYVS